MTRPRQTLLRCPFRPETNTTIKTPFTNSKSSFSLSLPKQNQACDRSRPSIHRSPARIVSCIVSHGLVKATNVCVYSSMCLILLRVPIHVLLTGVVSKNASQSAAWRRPPCNGALVRAHYGTSLFDGALYSLQY